MRWLILYLRSRSIPATVAVTMCSNAALWSLSRVVDSPAAPAKLALLATIVGALAISPALAGQDPELDKTAAIRWPLRRAAHVTLATAVVTGILSATALTGHPLNQAGPIARNVVGLAGLVA